MATIKLKFRPSGKTTQEGTLYYQIIQNRKTKRISPGYKIRSDEWNVHAACPMIPDTACKERRRYLVAIGHKIKEDLARMRRVLTMLELEGKPYTAERVAELYTLQLTQGGFLTFCRNLIHQLSQIGKIRTAETYTTALNSFTRFLGDTGDMLMDAINSDLIISYETYLKQQHLCPNSTSFYMRNLRAMYNRAVDSDLTQQRNPFKHVYTGIDKTPKRAVLISTIRQIRDLDLQANHSMQWARDLFMFSFYTRGMSFVDMAFLRKTDLQNGLLSYRRKKTGQPLYIKWEKPMQNILDRYDTTGTPFLLPIIQNPQKDERRQYKNAAHLVNNKLKKIGKHLGLAIPLTTYVARHGWASIAKSKNIPIATISEALGHNSERTTRIYLASLDTTVVDQANSLILNSIEEIKPNVRTSTNRISEHNLL